MLRTESILPADWFGQGDLDIQAATILLNQGGPLPTVAFHLQQAVEKYLKGFLLSLGQPLRRIHDLEVLVSAAMAQDADFAPFCRSVSALPSTTSRRATRSVFGHRYNQRHWQRSWARSTT